VRIAFFGSSHLSCLVLSRILASPHEIACVVTQPDQPAGRSMKLTPTVVAAQAAAAGLPVLKPARLRGDAEFLELLRGFHPDALLTASYGQIIPRSVLELTEWPLNVHPSLLPQLRGASPVRTALLQGACESGCCIMRMTPRLDDGDVLACEALDIPADWNHERLENELGALGAEMAADALDDVADGAVTLVAQNHAAATYCPTYSRQDTWIDWNRSARELHNFVRAWDPDIGAVTSLPDGRRLKVWRASAELDDAESDYLPGTIARISPAELAVATGRGLLLLHEVQPENKRRMPVAAFLAGHKLEAGVLLGLAG
jgi:methionyl-tRNA formyltransferase